MNKLTLVNKLVEEKYPKSKEILEEINSPKSGIVFDGNLTTDELKSLIKIGIKFTKLRWIPSFVVGMVLSAIEPGLVIVCTLYNRAAEKLLSLWDWN